MSAAVKAFPLVIARPLCGRGNPYPHPTRRREAQDPAGDLSKLASHAEHSRSETVGEADWGIVVLHFVG